MWKPDTAMMARTSNEMRENNPKRDESRVPIYMWGRRACKYQGMGVSNSWNIIWEGMLSWWRRKMRFFLSGMKS